jgi:sarcosine oxidase subunit gamma
VADQYDSGVSVERIENLSIVSLKVSRKSLESARNRLQLALPSSAAGGDPRSLWLGPDQWLLVSNSTTPDSIIKNCKEALAEILHSAVDYSAGLTALRIVGPNAGQLLATGSGIDFRPEKFPIHTCCRTRLAQIAAVIVAEAPEQFDIYIDRSYGTYLTDWLTDASSICAHVTASQGASPYQSEML